MRTIRATGRSAHRDGPLVQPVQPAAPQNDEMQQVAHIATCLPMTAIAGEPSGMMYELMAGRLACVVQVQQSFWPSMSTYHAGAFLALELKFDASGGNYRPVRAGSEWFGALLTRTVLDAGRWLAR
jgi:hypothetical protein